MDHNYLTTLIYFQKRMGNIELNMGIWWVLLDSDRKNTVKNYNKSLSKSMIYHVHG